MKGVTCDKISMSVGQFLGSKNRISFSGTLSTYYVVKGHSIHAFIHLLEPYFLTTFLQWWSLITGMSNKCNCSILCYANANVKVTMNAGCHR